MPTTTIALPATDIERARVFYRELLGFNPCEARALPVRFERRPEQKQPASDPIRVRLGIGKLSRLERALDVAWERGGQIVECAERTGRGLWSATIVDSEGNLVSLYARA